MVSSGKYYLKKQKRTTGLPESDLISIAISSLGLNDISIFDHNKKIKQKVLKNNIEHILSLNQKAKDITLTIIDEAL